MSDAPFARLPGGVLLGERHRTFVGAASVLRALWGDREAIALVDSGEEAAVLAGVALAVAATAGGGISPVRLAGHANDNTAVVVVVEEESGVPLLDVLQAVRGQPGAFPVEVACAVALRLLRFSRHVPHVDDLSFSWSGRLQASPLPRLQRQLVARFFSAEEARNARQGGATLLPRVGAILYELLTGESPLPVDHDADNFFNNLVAIIAPARISMGRRRADLPPPLVLLIDDMVAVSAAFPIDRHTAAHELAEWAVDDEQAQAFMASFLASSFAARKHDDREQWEQARLKDAATAPLWRIDPIEPVDDVTAALASLRNVEARTD